MGANKELKDVVIIGGGVMGCAIAQRLSRYRLSVLLLEKNPDLCFGTTKGTHGIIHAGLPSENTPLMNKLVVSGNSRFGEMCKNLDVPFVRLGKLLIALDEEDIKKLKKIKDDADKIGVPNVRMVDKHEIHQMEPEISNQVIGALYTPTTGFSSPWGLTFAFAENAIDNGVKILLDIEVRKINYLSEKSLFKITTTQGIIHSRYIVNCAGVYADEIARMIEDDSFQTIPLRMERYVLDENIDFLNHLVRSPRTSDFISPSKKENHRNFSNILLGQTAEVVKRKNDTETTSNGLHRIIHFANHIFPIIQKKDIITGFAGLAILNSRTADYIIEPSKNNSHLINVSIGGVGVSASPAIAIYVESLLQKEGLTLREKTFFNPYRKGIIEFRNLTQKEKEEWIKKDNRYGHVVCRCETVTEGEIVEAIHRGARTLDGIKYRTRAGMGRCQGGFCTPRVLKILSRELNVPITRISKKGNDSIILPFNVKDMFLRSDREL